MKYRAHQQAAIDYAQRVAEGTASESSIVAWVVPGGGKSWLPPLMLDVLGPEWMLAWFVPRLNLAAQAENDTLSKHGIRIRKSGNDLRPARDTRGFVATHHALVRDTRLWVDAMSDGRKWLLFFDELHHAYIDADGSYGDTARALAALPYAARVLMTGTMERSDRTQFIYGLEYEYTRDGQCVNTDPAIRYARATALQPSEGPAIVPVVFEHHDGPVKWDDLRLNGEIGGQLSKLDREDEGIGIWTACSTGIASEMLHRGLAEWKASSSGKAIVVCASQNDARKWVKEAGAYGNAMIAISDEDASQENIRRFRFDPNCRILVTVAMAYEGLDVPEITHGICLTHIRSVPWIEQMLARAWRKTPSKTECYWWVPDDPRMNRVIARIRAEQPALVVPEGNGGGGRNGEKLRVPLASASEQQRVSGLDGDIDCSSDDLVESLLWSFGLSDLIPQARELRRASHSEIPQSELEQVYRRQFWNEICRVNNEYHVPFPKVGGKINRRMGAKSENATIDQLRVGIRYAQEQWPPIGS